MTKETKETGADGRTFAERLRLLMESRRLSQAQLATALGVGNATVNQWVLGTSLPKARALLALADYFHTDVRYLLTGPGPEPYQLPRPGQNRNSK